MPWFAVTDLTRALLAHRSRKDKIAIAVDVGQGPPAAELEEINRLVVEGCLVFLDRAKLAHIGALTPDGLQRGVTCDIYQLTPLGVALCNELGIKQR